ncbi:hypothetical protein [Haloferula sp. BvORR071]|uniref:hypothetical protein n=1 Tax=Haloferula sp. BvORR071 TaxID=1396141 RepID=UPI002240FB9C|nr:hypothetical protein [Haloferula sp. BvORR071]
MAHRTSSPEKRIVAAPVKEEEAKAPLGDEPAKIRLAALAGRTKEARAKVAALIASGAKDEEVAEWLAPVLIADPGALDDLVAGIPEERRFALVRTALLQVVSLHPDSVWEVIANGEASREGRGVAR